MSEKRQFSVSGLTYTWPTLFAAMAIILVGNMTYALCIGVVPRIVPLKLKELEVSSTLMVFIMNTIGQIFNMSICQWVSFKSDRYRSSRWGRRVPFILYTLPMLCVSWLIIGLYKSEGELLRRLLARWVSLSPNMAAVIVLAIGVVAFKFFYMFVGSVFHYIYNDVIPSQFLTRFMGAIQISSQATVAFFNYFIFKHALSHFREIFIGTIIIYTLGMGFMCLALKEPRFPPASGQERKKSQGLTGLVTFMRESFSHPFYWYEFLGASALGLAGASNIFTVFFEKTMGLSLGQIGEKAAISAICVMIAGFVISSVGATLIDRWHPVRVYVFALMFGMISMVYDCKWIFFTPPTRVFWWAVLLIGQMTFLLRFRNIASLPALMKIFPKSRFGQFCSARSMASSILGLFFGLILGRFMDLLQKKLGLGDDAYRYIWAWQAFFYAVASFAYMMMYREFCRCGGYTGYCAPAPWSQEGFEKMEHAPVEKPNALWLRIAFYGFDVAYIGSLAMAGFWALFTSRMDAPAVAAAFVQRAIPACAVVLAAYFFVRFRIVSRISKTKDDISRIPHHGILLLAMLVRVLLMTALGVQTYLTLKSGNGELAAKMCVFDAAVDIVYILMIYIYDRMECNPPAATVSIEETITQ